MCLFSIYEFFKSYLCPICATVLVYHFMNKCSSVDCTEKDMNWKLFSVSTERFWSKISLKSLRTLIVLIYIVFTKYGRIWQMILLTFNMNKQNLDLFRSMEDYGFCCCFQIRDWNELVYKHIFWIIKWACINILYFCLINYISCWSLFVINCLQLNLSLTDFGWVVFWLIQILLFAIFCLGK